MESIDPQAIIASVPLQEQVVLSTLQICPSCGAGIGQVATVRPDAEIVRLRASLASHESALIAEQELAEQQQARIAELAALLREAAGPRSYGMWPTDFRTKVEDALGRKEGV